MGRKTVSIDEAVFDRLNGYRGDDESWSEFCERVADLLESQDEGPNTEPNTDEPLTEEHIDDIAAEVERRVERSLENLGTRR